MNRLISKLFFLIVFTSNVMAEDIAPISLSGEGDVTKALSVVEVLGESRGSGILAIMDGKTVIVTNSHNLQGKGSAMITHPPKKRFSVMLFSHDTSNISDGYNGFKGMARVLYDFPLSDVAILELPENLDRYTKGAARAFAYNSGVFDSKKGWIPNKLTYGFGDSVAAVLNGEATSLKGIEGLTGNSVPDAWISGDGNPVWIIPIYAKPGVSGGAYFKGGILTGLVTKISLGAEPIAIATPFSKVAKLLYSPDPSEKNVEWDAGGLMVYKGKDKTIILNPLKSGWLGNGGELSEVQDYKSGDSNPDYWRLQINTYGGSRIITTWDPFVYRPEQFQINNSDVGFVKVKSKSLFKSTESFRVPSLANFLASEKKGEQQTLLSNTPQNLALLKEARLKQKPNIAYGRIYKNDYRDSVYKIYNATYGNELGVQPLRPATNTRWGTAPKYYSKWAPMPITEMDRIVDVDSEGYFFNIPFSTKISDKTIFDLKIPGSFFQGNGHAYLKAPVDLSHVSLEIYEDSQKKEIILKPIEFNSPNSMVFKSDEDSYKIIYLYTNDDLTRLARIYFVSQSSLIELWAN